MLRDEFQHGRFIDSQYAAASVSVSTGPVVVGIPLVDGFDLAWDGVFLGLVAGMVVLSGLLGAFYGRCWLM